jgi:hypothetical protein
VTFGMISLLLIGGCGLSQEEFDALARQVSTEQAKSAKLEARLKRVESTIRGIGYQGLGIRWLTDGKWIKPEVRCRGSALRTPRDFATMPAHICVKSSFTTRKQPTSMRVQARSSTGEIVFKETVELLTDFTELFPAGESAYCFHLPGQSCESVSSIGIGTRPSYLDRL